MRQRFSSRSFVVLILAIPLILAASVSHPWANATITIVNGNAAGVGFNDPTPATPVGGNTGVTRGEQRLIAFQHAADIWGATLDSNVEIQVLATFEALSCNATSATLGSAGARFVFANFTGVAPFPGAEFPNTWYHQALADKRAGVPLNPGESDIRARFNVNLGNPGCLTGIGWYLGLDGNHGTQVDLVTVLLHEFGHGLGFSQFSSLTTGAYLSSRPDVYLRNLYDTGTGKSWDQMTNAERVVSAINSRRVVWTGAQVTEEIPDLLEAGTPLLQISSPAAIAGDYAVGVASFGPPLSAIPVSGSLVLALDAADASGPSTTDGCSPLTNGSAVAGNIALLDRGTCSFVIKTLNAQNAGAIGVVIADNVAGGPPAGLGGTDPTITIPAVRITRDDGNAIKAQLGAGVTASLQVDETVFAGANAQGEALMNAPNPVQTGSSISHWDPIASPNQLMEPAINGDLTHTLSGVDLTLALMRDVGWFADGDVDGLADDADNCPADANPNQEDLDHDGLGDVCDPDDDNDGVADLIDACPVDPPALGLDADRDGCTDTLGGLRAHVAGLKVLPTFRNGMYAKLDAAEADLLRGDVIAAGNTLAAFINLVEAQRVKGIDATSADLLIAYASNLIVLIGN